MLDEKYLINLKQKNRMIQLDYIRETERLKHEWEKERMRIKSADIRRSQERKANKEFAETMRHHG